MHPAIISLGLAMVAYLVFELYDRPHLRRRIVRRISRAWERTLGVM